MTGAFLAVVETGTALRSLDLQLGDPELEAALYNLVLFVEQAGPVGMAIAWLVGIVVILVVRGLALGLVGLIGRVITTRSSPPPQPAPPAPASRPAQVGPWQRPGVQSPPAPRPAAAVAAPPAPLLPAPAPPRAARPIVERSLRPGTPAIRDGAVVLQRPRGHMDGP